MKYSIEPRRWTALSAIAAVALAGAACATAEKKILLQKRSASHVALGRKLVEQNRLHEALTQATMALDEWDENPDAWFLKGQVKFGLGLYLQAIEDFSKAMEHHEDFTEALSWRAWAHAEAGDAAAAERDWRKALADPSYPSPEKIHLNLGMLMVQEGKIDDAMSHLERAVAKNPGYFRGHLELGKLKEQTGDLGGAIIAFQAALGGMKDSADLNLRLGLVLEKKGQGARAREHFKRVIELSPEGPEAEMARDHLRRLESAG